MWHNIPPIEFFNNYLVWVYYSILLDIESQGDFKIFFDAFPEKRKQIKKKITNGRTLITACPASDTLISNSKYSVKRK